MVRTPIQCQVLVDDSLNDARLFLRYFNKDTVQDVINELQNTEGGEIPTVVDGKSLEEQVYVPWTVHTIKPSTKAQIPGQIDIFSYTDVLNLQPSIVAEPSGSYVDNLARTNEDVRNQQSQTSSVTIRIQFRQQ